MISVMVRGLLAPPGVLRPQFLTSRTSCRFASSTCASTSSGGASASVFASTSAATATGHSKHPRKPGITHLGRVPRHTHRAALLSPTPRNFRILTARLQCFTVLTLTARSRTSPIWVSVLMPSPAHLYDPGQR
jgi:hypothetical protein